MPKSDYIGQSVHPEYLYKNLAIVSPSQAVLCEVNAKALHDALINSPELLKAWGLKLVSVKEQETKTQASKKKESTVKELSGAQ
jgi:hypothetical protein